MSRLTASLAALGQLVSTLLADYRKRYADHLYSLAPAIAADVANPARSECPE